MFYELLDSIHNKTARRAFGILGLILFPFGMIIAILLGLLGHAVGMVVGWGQDMIEFFGSEIPYQWTEMLSVVRTGYDTADLASGDYSA
jgi:hypothetical protein